MQFDLIIIYFILMLVLSACAAMQKQDYESSLEWIIYFQMHPLS
jgi:hypothetical protein